MEDKKLNKELQTIKSLPLTKILLHKQNGVNTVQKDHHMPPGHMDFHCDII